MTKEKLLTTQIRSALFLGFLSLEIYRDIVKVNMGRVQDESNRDPLKIFIQILPNLKHSNIGGSKLLHLN